MNDDRSKCYLCRRRGLHFCGSKRSSRPSPKERLIRRLRLHEGQAAEFYNRVSSSLNSHYLHPPWRVQVCFQGTSKCSLGENGYMYMHDWVPLLSTPNYHNIVNQLYPKTKLKFKKQTPQKSLLLWAPLFSPITFIRRPRPLCQPHQTRGISPHSPYKVPARPLPRAAKGGPARQDSRVDADRAARHVPASSHHQGAFCWHLIKLGGRGDDRWGPEEASVTALDHQHLIHAASSQQGQAADACLATPELRNLRSTVLRGWS